MNFTRWYIKNFITRIPDKSIAELILKDKSNISGPVFPDLSVEDRTTLLMISDEVYHCNIKLPMEQVRELWASSDQPLGLYAKFGTVDYYDQYQASLESGGDGTGPAVPIPGGFYDKLFQSIWANFVLFQKEKIKKVGQYLEGNPDIKLEALDRPLAPGGVEGLYLLNALKENSEIHITGRYYVDNDANLMYFQALLFLPGDKAPTTQHPLYGNRINVVNGPIPGIDGVAPLALEELRQIACKPNPKKKNKKKPDDPNAEKNIEKGKKTARDIKRKQLSNAEKRDIGEQVKKRINQVGDAAFLNALINAGDLETREDIINFCLYVIPLRELVEIGLQCASKYIEIRTPDETVCDIILRNLSSEDIQKIMAYMNVNLTTNSVAQQFKAQVVDTFQGDWAKDPSGFKDWILNQFNDGNLLGVNVGTKEIICAMVFLALPAAITLLSLYLAREVSGNVTPEGTCGDPLSPGAKEAIARLENPFKKPFMAVLDGLKNHPIVSFSKDLPKNLVDQLVLIANQLLVQGVGYCLQEIRLLCEESSKSDLANAPSGAALSPPNINDFNDDPGVYNGLLDFLDDQIDSGESDPVDSQYVTRTLIERFFEDLNLFLTISELCILFSGNATIGDINYDFALEKVFYGLLQLDTYAPLAAVLNTTRKLSDFLDIYGENFNQALCAEKIEELTKSKKLLSDLCRSTNDAYVNGIKDQIGEEAICSLLEQDQAIIDKLFDAIKQLVDPEIPEAFCGPEAERLGKTPLLASFQDDSQLHLAEKHLNSVFSAAVKTFELEVDNFKSVLTVNPLASGVLQNSQAMPDSIKNIFGLGTNIAAAMAETYSIKVPDEDGNNTTPVNDGLKIYLQNITSANKFVAPKVKSFLQNMSNKELITNIIKFSTTTDQESYDLEAADAANSAVDTEGNVVPTGQQGAGFDFEIDTFEDEIGEAIQFGDDDSNQESDSPSGNIGIVYEIFTTPDTNATTPDSQEQSQIKYTANYSNVVFKSQSLNGEPLPARTARLSFTMGGNTNFIDKPLPFTFVDVLEYTEENNSKNNPFQYGGLFSNMAYHLSKAPNISPDSDFNQIIKDGVYSPEFYIEFLETIISEHSELVSSSDLFIKENLNKLQLSRQNTCDPSLIDFSDILEKLRERVRYCECKVGFGTVPTPSEMVHIASLFEAAVRVTTLTEAMKSFFVFVSFGYNTLMREYVDGEGSFYLQYLTTAISAKMDNIIPEEQLDSVKQMVIWAAESDMKKSDVDYFAAIKYFVGISFTKIQSLLKRKLENAGYFSDKLSDSGEFQQEFKFSEYQQDYEFAYQTIKNMIPPQKNLAILQPPIVRNIDFSKKETIVPAGTYSANPRLRNGGLFIERGFEILHHSTMGLYQSPSEISQGSSPLNSEKLQSIIDGLPTWEYPISVLDPASYPGIHKGSAFESPLGSISDTTFTAHFASNMFNIVGRKLDNEQFTQGFDISNILLGYNSNEAGVPEAYIFSKIQKILFGGVPIVESGAPNRFYSTLWINDYPAKFPPSGLENEEDEEIRKNRIISLRQFTSTQGRLPIELIKSDNDYYGFQDVLLAKDVFAEELQKGMQYAFENQDIPLTHVKKLLNIPESENIGYDTAINATFPQLAQKFKDLNTYFDSFNEYSSLNLLIEILEDEDGATVPAAEKSLTLTKQIIENIILSDSDTSFAIHNNQTFLQAILERKYFIREEDTNRLYFKLPLRVHKSELASTTKDIESLLTNEAASMSDILSKLVKDPGIVTPQSLIDFDGLPFSSPEETQYPSEKFGYEDEDSCILYWFNQGYQGFQAEQWCKPKNTADLDPAETPPPAQGLNSLFESFSYNDLLSFVSVYVTKTLSEEYPNLNRIFQRTENILTGANKQALATANRINEPNLYKNDIQENIQAYEGGGDLFEELGADITQFFEGVIKGVANITDPTWRTPWFLPGPLTPFGIIAKILDGNDSEDKTPEKSVEEIQESVDNPFATKCDDDASST